MAGASLLALFGCASPGNPRPPSLHLPEPVSNLTAHRVGDTIVLDFLSPTKSTDGFALTSPVKASLCRAVAAGPCVTTRSFPAAVTVSGAVRWTDVLPDELISAAPQKLSYKVELFNTAGRSAGGSDPAFAASGPAPAPVRGLQATGERDGIILRWMAEPVVTGEVLLERRSLNQPQVPTPAKATTPPAQRTSSRKAHAAMNSTAHPQSDRAVLWLHATGTPGRIDSGGTVDTSAKPDTPYRYTAVRSRTVTLEGISLELRSAPSVPVEFTLHDTYAPAVPLGLMAADYPVEGATGAAGVAVDLLWQPNREDDLAGYNVYRQTVGGEGTPGALPEKLNALPVVLPAFRDATASHARHYRYTVTAVDAKGNASAASTAVDVNTAP